MNNRRIVIFFIGLGVLFALSLTASRVSAQEGGACPPMVTDDGTVVGGRIRQEGKGQSCSYADPSGNQIVVRFQEALISALRLVDGDHGYGDRRDDPSWAPNQPHLGWHLALLLQGAEQFSGFFSTEDDQTVDFQINPVVADELVCNGLGDSGGCNAILASPTPPVTPPEPPAPPVTPPTDKPQQPDDQPPASPAPSWQPSWPALDAKIEDVHPQYLADWLWRKAQAEAAQVVIPEGKTDFPDTWDLMPLQGVETKYFEVPEKGFRSEIRPAEIRSDGSVNPIGSSTAVWSESVYLVAYIHQLVAPWLPEMVGAKAIFEGVEIAFVETSGAVSRSEASQYIEDRPGVIHFYSCVSKNDVVVASAIPVTELQSELP